LLAALDVSDEQRPLREAALYGIDHAKIAAAVARTLGLPDLFVAVAGAHHLGLTGLQMAGAASLAVAIDAAASLPHRLPSFSTKVLNPLMVRLKFTAKSSSVDLTALAGEIADDYFKISALFDKPDSAESFKQFLQNLSAEVAGCLQASIMSSATEIGGLKEHQRRLSDVVAVLEDKTQRAEFDPLTKTLTRAAFLARLDKLLPMARRHGASCAVGFLDLDDFKRINDSHGHATGDAALVATAAVLADALKETGIAGRMGGDEFVFAFVSRPEVFESTIASVVEKMASIPFTHKQMILELTTSIGILPLGIPAADMDSQRALHDADQLMYEAKRAGKARGAVGKARPAAVVLV
jgi:diguanylate cyclase (GGDEF)-like protein